jgi:DNA-binding transcriptional ArsR family regulator
MKTEGMSEKNVQKKEDNMQNNFLLISLEENKAKKIAEVISNETSRKIIDHLAKKECTETDLSKELNIPISTIHYNLKQLMDVNLVIVDEFHYSSKGKEVNHYKLANKYIIIAPKSDNNRFMEALNKVLPLGIITIAAGFVLSAFSLFTGSSVKMSTGSNLDVAPKLMAASSEALSKTATTATQTTSVSRPLLQSEMIAWFFIGALSLIVVYFVYELVRKRK